MRVAVVGAGVSGAACAAALRGRGVEVDVFERGRAPGGRLASPRLHGRRVDLGAAYFTVADASFVRVVSGWASTGLARQWTDALDAVDGRTPGGDSGRAAERERKPGPMRWAAPDGLRSLAHDLLERAGLTARAGQPVEQLATLPHDAVVLAMPDPQARWLLGDAVDWVSYEPVISVAAGWSRRHWARTDAIFVNGDPDVSLIADDGARRGDDAPVLVVHTTVERARRHLDAPDAVPATLAAVRRLLGFDAAPSWAHAHRWRFAKPAATHGERPFGTIDVAGRPVGLCGDSWCPSGAPRVEAAWLSGHRLGTALARRD